MMYETLAKVFKMVPPPKSAETANAVGQMVVEFFSGQERARDMWIAWCKRGNWKPWLQEAIGMAEDAEAKGKTKGNTEQTEPN